jgi:hypothetical protein
MSEMCQLAKQDRKRWNFHSTCQTLSRFALKLGFCRFYIPRNDRIVLVRVFPMRDVAVAIRADRSDIQWVICSSVRERPDMVDFEIWLSVPAHERCVPAAFTISS